jgi:hypothetical protein
MTDSTSGSRSSSSRREGRPPVASTPRWSKPHWLIGREIVEVEQAGEQRAGYGQSVIERLSAPLKRSFGKGFSRRNLWNMRQFYLAFPGGSALAAILQTPSAEFEPGNSADTVYTIARQGELFQIARCIHRTRVKRRPNFGGGLQRIQSRQDREPPHAGVTGSQRRDMDPPPAWSPSWVGRVVFAQPR